jgi:hypothetical protein
VLHICNWNPISFCLFMFHPSPVDSVSPSTAALPLASSPFLVRAGMNCCSEVLQAAPNPASGHSLPCTESIHVSMTPCSRASHSTIVRSVAAIVVAGHQPTIAWRTIARKGDSAEGEGWKTNRKKEIPGANMQHPLSCHRLVDRLIRYPNWV